MHEILPLLLDELGRAPTLVVIEDVHWADEATLDLVALLGRRIRSTRGLVVVSCRDDELGADHPLLGVLGSLAAAGVERVQLAPLSVAAVRELAGPRPVDAAQLRRRSGGNPFFVTEVLAAGGEVLPRSVRDAVIARAAALDPDARALLEDLSVVTGPAPPELVAELGRTAPTTSAPACRRGCWSTSAAGSPSATTWPAWPSPTASIRCAASPCTGSPSGCCPR